MPELIEIRNMHTCFNVMPNASKQAAVMMEATIRTLLLSSQISPATVQAEPSPAH
jgi:hypothetical protein